MDQPLTENARILKVQLSILVCLQEQDGKINYQRKQIKSLKEKIEAEDEKLWEQREALDGRKRELEQLKKERHGVELSFKEKQALIQKLGGQLFEVKTNAAYNTLSSEINQHKQENSLLEERALEMMMAEDDLLAGIAQAEKVLAGEEQREAALKDEIQREISNWEKEIDDLQAQWKISSQEVKPVYLERYCRLRDAKGGRAVVKIENDICDGCRMAIRPQAVIELQKYRELLCCDNCARILYVE
ncbi:hypothetical protein KAR10_04265 [bacterium]|nr:hypothetical protein [bacterium]